MSAPPVPREVRAPRRTWHWGACIAAVLSSVVCLGLLTLLLLPPLQAASATEIAGGTERFDVAEGVVVTPEAEWSVRPGLSAPVAWPVRPGTSDGLVLQSPDRVFTVTVVAPAEARSLGEFAALEEARASASLRIETLANGVEVRHVTSKSKITAALELPGRAVIVTGEVPKDVELDDYRVAFAELLLEIRPSR